MTAETGPESRYPFVHVVVPVAETELASFYLWELGAQGVEERDLTTFSKPDAGPAEHTATLIGSFSDDAAAEAAAAELGERWPARVTHVVGDDWRDGWRAHFKPLRVGRRLVIRPSWEPFAAAAEDVVLTLDPGGAFGTGTHESTRLALALLEDVLPPDAPTLDVGCGSGILSIAALRLGSGPVLAVDVDPAAVEATGDNARANGVQDRLRAETTPIESVTGRFPLVLANIEAHVLVPLSAPIAARVAEGGLLVLSGILREQIPRVEAEYIGQGPFKRIASRAEGDWEAVVLQRGDG